VVAKFEKKHEEDTMSETINSEMKTTYIIVPEVEYLNREAREMVNAGNLEDALGLFARALSLDPSSANTWCNQGNCLDELGMHRDAVESYNRTIEIDPCHAEAWYNKGMSLKKMGNFPEAEHCVNRAVLLAQGLPE
jgi:tetratricopeptide (TPR) repeat protein